MTEQEYSAMESYLRTICNDKDAISAVMFAYSLYPNYKKAGEMTGFVSRFSEFTKGTSLERMFNEIVKG